MYPVPKNRVHKIVVILCFYFLPNSQFVQAQCIASGPNSPATASSVSFSGSDYDFNNPLNILADDISFSQASSVFSLFSKQTEYLQAKDFGFTIPTGATICGIEVTVVKRATNLLPILAYVKDHRVRVIKNNAFTPDDKANPAEWSSSETYTSYGGVNELWGTTWSPTDINNNTFGFSISAEIVTTVSLFPSARIDHISMTVHYLDPTVLPAHSIQFHVANGAKNTAVLSWKPTDLEEAALFTIERSVNGTKWEELNGPPQKSTVSPLLTFTDGRPLPGKSFYRLKKMAASGEVRYSTALPFETTDITSIKCYPNPSTSFIKVTGVLAGEQVTLTDIYGKRLYLSSPAISNTIKIDVSDLQPGMYVISTGKKKMKIQKK